MNSLTKIPRLYTTKQASELTGIPERTLRYFITTGILAARRTAGARQWWLTEQDLLDLVNNMETNEVA